MSGSLLTVLTVLAVCTSAAYGRMAYQLPDGAELLLRQGSFRESFDCTGRQYGFYADMDNECQLFHVCLPIEDDQGAVIETAHFTFLCGQNTVFDQATLSCNYAEYALPCAESQNFYDVINSEFGVIPLKR